MPKVKFSLGNVTFGSFEVPEQFDEGGETDHKKHNHPGGGRTVTAFGVHELPVAWSGWFWGATAPARLEALRQMQALCQPVAWIYGDEEWTVLVTKVQGTRHHKSKIRYAIALEIIESKNRPKPQAEPDPDAAIQRGMDQASLAINLPSSLFFPGLLAASLFNALASAMDANKPWTGLDFLSAGKLVAQCLGVESAFETLAGPLRSANDINAFNGLLDAESALSGVRLARINMASYFGIQALGAAGALAGASLVAGTSVWQLAAQKFGDPTQGIGLLNANGLTSPNLTTPTAIAFPPPAPGTFDIAILGNNGAG
jgi:hypothetical protein